MGDKYKKKNDLKRLGPAPRMPRIDPINPPDVNTTYRSQINTSAPLTQSFQQSLLGTKLPTSTRPGTGATGMSRSAFAQALLDDTGRTLAQEMDRFNVAQMTQAEKSRAEDILSQRQSGSDRRRMDVMRDIFEADTDQRYRSGMKDLKEQYAREKKEAQASVTASILGGL